MTLPGPATLNILRQVTDADPPVGASVISLNQRVSHQLTARPPKLDVQAVRIDAKGHPEIMK